MLADEKLSAFLELETATLIPLSLEQYDTCNGAPAKLTSEECSLGKAVNGLDVSPNGRRK